MQLLLDAGASIRYVGVYSSVYETCAPWLWNPEIMNDVSQHPFHAGSTASPPNPLVLRGKTQMDELAYSLNGENSHYGTPVNPAAPGRIPGGSSSGSAVSVCARFGGKRERLASFSHFVPYHFVVM